jgi:hypothetical protein
MYGSPLEQRVTALVATSVSAGRGEPARRRNRAATFPRVSSPARTWLSRTAALLLFVFAISSPASALTEVPQRKAPSCAGHEATIVSGPGGGDVVGTQGRDVIVLANGWDTADGRGGNDVICGRGGPDNIRGGPGRDLLFGDEDNDNLYGQAGKDRLVGNGGSDRLDGGALKDVLDGGRGSRDDVAYSDAPRRAS